MSQSPHQQSETQSTTHTRPKPLLEIRELGKAYRRYPNELMRVASWFSAIKPLEETWILRDVNFDIAQGEAVGIVGQNGAGKSTLLKMITGTLRPTEGYIRTHGRVAAILELGMGFNGELTGRQNVLHSAGLMGFTHAQIDDAMEDIEAFAEIGDYFDQPMRVYSSGMQMRVAFSVATAFRPEVLIVDEALSVGDAYFQHKSFDRIREFQRQGTSLLIVSHDKAAIQSLCDRAILLDQGRVLEDGLPQDIMDYYNAIIAQKENAKVEITPLDSGQIQTRSGSGEASVKQISLHATNGNALDVVDVGQPVELRIEVAIHADLPELVAGYKLKDRVGQDVFGTNTWHTHQVERQLNAGETLTYCLRFNANLGPGSYSVSLSLHRSDTHLTHNYQWIDHALVFQMVNMEKDFFLGTSWVMPTIQCERKTAKSSAPNESV
ncbi:ABC transporter ATP-binding protein [Halomonas llamarensis]|uniref:ABC transporter ATP-binding protein n=1 Tax=Halomonas llamarensis TaxID=2945104 RepID=A0ABT0SP63_9GAMM|nr:ABC transporter ATP-binding protein [Halomonas llamarensis]MCL7929589.1 ABC transporter ATP-binding protein [Halomonas llamarensis]